MAKHQIIYTSCMRGMDGANDGQQVFSYDRDFKDSKSDAIKSLFSFQIPALSPGQVMTEELAKEMPYAFTYRYLKDGRCAVSLNTYLGRDYMGSSGRFGNQLSHSIICDFEDMDMYPCELFKSPALRDHMEFEEVNNPDLPEYLPEPALEKGYITDVDSIVEFLGEGERLSYFRQMVAAMLSFDSQKKRLIICDEQENIVKWIAALQYTLPMDVAKTMNVAGYVYDPELASFRICGVVPQGTRYEAVPYVQSGRHFVFDFTNEVFTPQEAPAEELLDFIDMAMSVYYDSLTDFFHFMLEKTTYREADENYYKGYLFYSLVMDGFSEVTPEKMGRILNFAKEYVTPDFQKEFLGLLIENRGILDGWTGEEAAGYIRYMLANVGLLTPEEVQIVKDVVIRRIFASYEDPMVTESEFKAVYDSAREMSQSLGITEELMVHIRKVIVPYIQEGHVVAEWKLRWILEIVRDCVMNSPEGVRELYPEQPMESICCGIFSAVYDNDRSGIEKLEDYMMDLFDRPIYLENTAVNLEDYLREKGAGEEELASMWKRFESRTKEYEGDTLRSVCEFFGQYKRYDRIYRFYVMKMDGAQELKEAEACLDDTVDNYFAMYPDYAKAYGKQVMETYYEKYRKALSRLNEGDLNKYRLRLWKRTKRYATGADYIDALMESMADAMTEGKMKREDLELLDDMADFQLNILKQNVSGRCLLLLAGSYLAEVRGRRDLTQIVKDVANISGDRPVVLKGEKKQIDRYWDWALSELVTFSLKAEDYTKVWDMYEMSSEAEYEFVLYCARESFAKAKGKQPDYSDFGEFTEFLFEKGNETDLRLLERFLQKNARQRLEEMDPVMERRFKNDTKYKKKWMRMSDEAKKPGNLFDSFTDLFKKKKEGGDGKK